MFIVNNFNYDDIPYTEDELKEIQELENEININNEEILNLFELL